MSGIVTKNDSQPGGLAILNYTDVAGRPALLRPAGSLAGGDPSLSEISQGLIISVERQRDDSDIAALLELPGLLATVNRLGKITFQHDGAASAGFGYFTEMISPSQTCRLADRLHRPQFCS